MAPSSNRSTRAVTPGNLSKSRNLTKRNQRRSKMSANQRSEISQDEHAEAEFEPDFDERFIRSIEELLPDQDHNGSKSATPLPAPSAQISPITPGTPIKVERVSDSADEMYDVSPLGYVYKAADVGRRQTSRSTAQLTTPGSSPEGKRDLRSTVAGTTIPKSEILYKGDGRQSVLETSYSPPVSMPQEKWLIKRPASITIPINKQDIRKSPTRADRSLATTVLSPKPTLGKQDCLQSTALVDDQVTSSKTLESQENYDKQTLCESLDAKSPIECLPTLPPPKPRPIPSKIMSSTAGQEEIAPVLPSILRKSLRAGEDAPMGKIHCKSLCAQLASEAAWKEHGLRASECPDVLRPKIVSPCPSSISSFGLHDDIPTSDRMHREARRAVTESARAFACDRMLGISPSLRHNGVLARLGINDNASDNSEKANDTYEDFDEDSLPRKDPCRAIFGKARKIVTDRSRISASLSPQRSRSMEEGARNGDKRLQHISSRSLRSFSAAYDLSKKSRNLSLEVCQRDEQDPENEPCYEWAADEDRDETEYLRSESEESVFRLEVKSSDQTTKRARDVINDWSTFSDDEDMVDEDDFIEIGRDVFELSENNRKKRRKSNLDRAIRDSGPAIPVPKAELIEENELISVTQDSVSIEAGSEHNADNPEQEKTPCDYYMNTYWEHGRASDGRKARDGFISYIDFKEYCRKCKQPTDDCMLKYKRDLKHYLICEHHASLRQDLYRIAWNFEHNPGFSFKSCSRDEETRRSQNEAIGNAPSRSPSGSSRALAPAAEGQVAEIFAEALTVLDSSHKAVIAQLVESKKRVESKLKGAKRQIARVQKR